MRSHTHIRHGPALSAGFSTAAEVVVQSAAAAASDGQLLKESRCSFARMRTVGRRLASICKHPPFDCRRVNLLYLELITSNPSHDPLNLILFKASLLGHGSRTRRQSISCFSIHAFESVAAAAALPLRRLVKTHGSPRAYSSGATWRRNSNAASRQANRTQSQNRGMPRLAFGNVRACTPRRQGESPRSGHNNLGAGRAENLQNSLRRFTERSRRVGGGGAPRDGAYSMHAGQENTTPCGRAISTVAVMKTPSGETPTD